MVRGSLPVFWEQKGVTENVALTRGPEMTKRSFHKHFDDLISTYGPIYAVDLLSDTTAREIILTKEYIRQIYDCEFKDKIRFLHLDFHAYCKGDKYDQLKIMVSKLESGLQDFGWFVEDLAARKVLRLQTGAFRVNCLDSLDRTNVAQSKLGLTLLQR
jgi:phosphatidylinositol-bisphosphatase